MKVFPNSKMSAATSPLDQLKKWFVKVNEVWDWLASILLALQLGSSERQLVLDWVSTYVTQPPTDLSESWRNGIMLCELADKFFPEVFQGLGLLDPQNCLHNVSLALEIIKSSFRIEQEITAEDVVTCVPGTEGRLLKFLHQLKEKVESIKAEDALSLEEKNTVVLNSEESVVDDECFAQGTGLVIGFLGRRASFTVFNYFCLSEPDLVVDIKGPQNTHCCERITKRSPKRRNSRIQSGTRRPTLAQCGRSRSHTLLWTIREDISKDQKLIPLEYEIKDGSISIGYVPLKTGPHTITLLWHGQYVIGCPFVAIIEDSFDSQGSRNAVVRPPILRKESPLSASGSRKSSVRFKEPEESKVKLGRVKSRRVLRYIVRIAEKDVVIEAENSEMLAPALQKLDIPKQGMVLGPRRNSWGFVGDTHSQRKLSLMKQVCIDNDEDGEDRHRSSSVSVVLPASKTMDESTLNPKENQECSVRSTTEKETTEYISDTNHEAFNITLLHNNPRLETVREANARNSSVSSDGKMSSETDTQGDAEEDDQDCRDEDEVFDKDKCDTENHEVSNSSQTSKLSIRTTQLFPESVELESFTSSTAIEEYCLSTNDSGNVQCQSGETERDINSDTGILKSSQVHHQRPYTCDSDPFMTDSETSDINTTQFSDTRCVLDNGRDTAQENVAQDVHSMMEIKESVKQNSERKHGLSYANSTRKNNGFDKNIFEESCNVLDDSEQVVETNQKYTNVEDASDTNSKINSNQTSLNIKHIDELNTDFREFNKRLFTTKHFISPRSRTCTNKTGRGNATDIQECVLKSNNTAEFKCAKSIETRKNQFHPYLRNSLKAEIFIENPGEVEAINSILNTSPNTFTRSSQTEISFAEYDDPHICQELRYRNFQEENYCYGLEECDVTKKASKFSLVSYRDENCTTDNENVSRPNSVVDIVRDFQERSVKHPTQHSDKSNNIYLQRLFFPPLAANEDRKSVKKRISKWEKSISAPKNRISPPLRESVSLHVSVQSKVAFWEKSNHASEDSETPGVLKPAAKSCRLVEENRASTGQSDPECAGSHCAQEPGFESSRGRIPAGTVFSHAVTSELTEDSGISDDLLMCLKTSDYQRSSPMYTRQRSLSDPGFRTGSARTTEFLSNDNINTVPSSVCCTSDCSSHITTSNSEDDNDEYIDDEIPDYAAMYLGDYVSFTRLLGPEKSLPKNDALTQYLQKLEDKSRHIFDPSLSRPHECRVLGIGVHYGLVSLNNHFQVLTKGAGCGNLSVNLQGSGRHDVAKIMVTYFKNDVYDVMYQVLEPGYYIISVRWSDWSIPGSPFICKVTY